MVPSRWLRCFLLALLASAAAAGRDQCLEIDAVVVGAGGAMVAAASKPPPQAARRRCPHAVMLPDCHAKRVFTPFPPHSQA